MMNSEAEDDQEPMIASAGKPSGINEVVFRLATLDDVPKLQEMLELFVRQHKLLRRTPEELAVLTKHGFIAELNDEIVGFCAVEVYSRKLAEIQSLAVATHCQGKGIGRKLVMMCLDRARELDVMEVLAITSSEEFLRGCGFDYSLPDQKKAMFCQLRPRTH